jgi:hypothetical protein
MKSVFVAHRDASNANLKILFDRLIFMRLVVFQASARKAMQDGYYYDAGNDYRCSEDSDFRHHGINSFSFRTLDPADSFSPDTFSNSHCTLLMR